MGLSITLFLSAVASGGGCAQTQQAEIDVTPAAPTVVSGAKLQLTVTRHYPGGPIEDVTHKVSYHPQDKQIALVGERGELTAGDKTGSVIVRVRDEVSDATAFTTVTVVPARIESITIDPSPALVLAPGESRPFKAKARYDNATERDVTSEVQWATSDEAVAGVGRTPSDAGVVTTLREGDATITATDPTSLVRGQTLVFVRGATVQLKAIVVTPNPALIPVAQSQQFVAMGIFGDGSSREMTRTVVWASARPEIATIDANGLARGVAAGDVTLTASSSSPGIRGSAAVKVQ